MHQAEPSPFDVVEEAFRLLVTAPVPASLDGALVGPGWPARAIPLDELRSRLLHPSTPYGARDAALNLLVRQAQAKRDPFLVGLAGILLPGLRRAAAPLAAVCPPRAADIEAEMLAGLVEAVRRWQANKDRVATHLVWAASRRARALVAEELAYRSVVAQPPARDGHPDLVLAEAVKAGVLTAAEAELIGATRLGAVPLRQLAAERGVPYDVLQKQRRRAELDLLAWIFRDRLSANGPKATVIGVSDGPGRGGGTGSPRKRRQPQTSRR